MKILLLIAGLVLALLSATPGSFGQSGPAKGKPGTTKKPPEKRPVPATPPATTAKGKTLSLSDVRELVIESQIGDTDCARLIENAQLPLAPEEDWVEGLFSNKNQGRQKNERPACYGALLKRVPPGPSVAEVEQAAPLILEQAQALVKAGKKDDMEPLFRPMLLSTELMGGLGDAGKMYPQVGQIFGLFDTGRYQKHQLGKFMPIRGRKVGVPVYVLTRDIVENFYFVVFTKHQDKIVIREVVQGRTIAEFALVAEMEWAKRVIQDLFRDLNQGSDATARQISTPSLYEDIKKIGGWKRFKRDERLSVEDISIQTTVPLDGKSVRVVARVTVPLTPQPLKFDIDFERVGAEFKAVRARDLPGKDISFDKELDCYIEKRYGLGTTCAPYNSNSTEDFRFLESARLIDYARRAVETSKPDEIEEYAQELQSFFGEDKVRGLPLGLKATAQFLRGNYSKFYQIGSEAVKKNGEVYVPLLRQDNGLSQAANGASLKPMILGISSAGLRYIPSFQDSQRGETFVTRSNLKAFKFNGERPWIDIELEGLKEKTWKLVLPGSSCGMARQSGGEGPSRSQSQPLKIFKRSRISLGRDHPCGISIGIPLPGPQKQPEELYIPENWEEIARNLADLYKVASSQPASPSGK